MSDRNPISVKAVALGLLVDVVGTISAGIVGVFVLAFVWGAQGVKPQDAEAKAEQLSQDTTFLLACAAVGTGFTIFGGYIAGRMCQAGPTLHGALVGFTGVVLGLLLSLPFWGEVMKGPDWFVVGQFLVPIPAGAFGGYLASLHGPKPRPRDPDDEYEDDRDRFD
jgi:hypothetical protein